MSPEGQSSRGVLYALLAYSFWGLIPAYYKFIEHIPAAEMAAHRAIWTAVIGTALIAALGKLPQFLDILRRPRLLLTLILSGACIASNWLVFLWAVVNHRMVETAMGYFVNPLFSVMLGVILLRERLRPGQIAAIVIAGTGVAYLVFHVGYVPWVAIFLPFTFGLYGFIRKHTAVDSLSGITMETAFMLPVALGYVAWISGRGETHFGPSSGMDNLYLLSVGPITLLPLTLFAAAARRVRLTTMGILQYFSPTLTFLLAVFAYHEPFDRIKLNAFCLIWGSLLIFTLEGVRFSRLGAPRVQPNPLPE